MDYRVKRTTHIGHRYKRRTYKKNKWEVTVNRAGDIEVAGRGTNADMAQLIYVMIKEEKAWEQSNTPPT
jgi:hypothetical protein